MSRLFRRLEGGDRRSIGRSNEVADFVLRGRERFAELFEGLFHADARVRLRAADALEKVSAKHPEWLQPYGNRLLREVAAIEQKEVQWHLGQMLGRMEWNGSQLRRAAGILLRMLDESDSQIVRVNALQALAELARNHPNLRASVRPLIQECQRTGGPALRARARRLLRS